jgi:hypothetical protein
MLIGGDMTKLLETRLARLYNLPTRYEVAAINQVTGQRVLLFYSSRFTRQVVTHEVVARMDHIARVTGVDPYAWEWSNRVGDGVLGLSKDGETWHIRKTGRTQRQAYINGELDYVEDIDV